MKTRSVQFSWIVPALFLASAGFADPTPVSSPFHVEQLDPDFDISGLAGPGIEVNTLKEAPKGAKNPKPRNNLPTSTQRDQLLAHAGLAQEIVTMDELDRDQLLLRARRLPLSNLSKVYPTIAPEKLRILSRLAREDVK